MTATERLLRRLSPRYEVAFACELSEMAKQPLFSLKRKPNRFLGVLDELSVTGGRVELPGGAPELDPTVTHLGINVDGATGVVRGWGLRSDRGRQLLGFEFVEFTPELERLVFDCIAEAKSSRARVPFEWEQDSS